MQAGDAVKGHDGVGLDNEVFAVAPLALVVVVVGQLVVACDFLVREDILRLQIIVVLLFDLFDFMRGHVQNQPLLLIQLR